MYVKPIMEEITISDKHSNHKGQTVTTKLQGTNPEFAFIWINDVCYTLSKSANTFKLKKTK